MYGLCKDLDISFFVGRTLNSITFGLNIIYFNFDKGVTVDLSSSYRHQKKSDAVARDFGAVQTVFRCQSSSLMQLLEHSVVSAQAGDGDEAGTLSLTFDNGDVLSFIETPGPYECYEFTDGENSWVV